MGDHAGVDFVQDAHVCRLRAEGLLQPEVQLSGRKPVPFSDGWQTVCIDDFISIGAVDVARALSGVGADLEAFDKAEQIYLEDGLLGSPSKAWRGQMHWTALGAECLSAPGWVQRG